MDGMGTNMAIENYRRWGFSIAMLDICRSVPDRFAFILNSKSPGFSAKK